MENVRAERNAASRCSLIMCRRTLVTVDAHATRERNTNEREKEKQRVLQEKEQANRRHPHEWKNGTENGHGDDG